MYPAKIFFSTVIILFIVVCGLSFAEEIDANFNSSDPLEEARQFALEARIKDAEEYVKDKPYLTVDKTTGYIQVVDQEAYEEAKKQEQAEQKETFRQNTSDYIEQPSSPVMGPSERLVHIFRVKTLSDFLRLLVIIVAAIGILKFVDSIRKWKSR